MGQGQERSGIPLYKRRPAGTLFASTEKVRLRSVSHENCRRGATRSAAYYSRRSHHHCVRPLREPQQYFATNVWREVTWISTN